MGPEQAKACSSCFYTSQFPGIKIEENGKCNFCNSGNFAALKSRQTPRNLEALRRLAKGLKEAREAKNGKYDCIVGCSGGLDSSYVLYVAKKLLGLNPLAVKYDHGFNYELANRNVKALCESLGVDLKIVKSQGGHDRNCFKYRVKALGPLGNYFGVCSFCGYACHAVILLAAGEHNLPFFLVSNNFWELGDLDQRFKIKSSLKAFWDANFIQKAKTLFYLAVSQYYLMRLKMEFYVPPARNLFRRQPKLKIKGGPGPAFWFNVTEYVPWDLNQMVKTLESETGWRAPEAPQLPMRFDCIIEDGFVNHTRKKTAGMTVHGVIASRLIADNLRTKDELQPTVEFYDQEISEQIKEMEQALGLKPR